MNSLSLFLYDYFSLTFILSFAVGVIAAMFYFGNSKKEKISLTVSILALSAPLLSVAYLFVNTENIWGDLPLDDTKKTISKITKLDNERKREIGEIGFSFPSGIPFGRNFLPISPIFVKKFQLLMSGELSVPVDTDEIFDFQYLKLKELKPCKCDECGLNMTKEMLQLGKDGSIDQSEYRCLMFLLNMCLRVKKIEKTNKAKLNIVKNKQQEMNR